MDKTETYKDKILSYIIGKTKIKSTEDENKIIIEPPFIALQAPFYLFQLNYESDIESLNSSNPFPLWAFFEGFKKYCELFDLSRSESRDLFKSYNDELIVIIKNEYFDKEPINESMDKQKQFLYKVADQLVRETDIDLVNDRIRYPYGGLNTTCGGVVVDTPFIVSHLINVYGLTNKEIDEVVSMYTQFIKRKLKFDLRSGRINENVDKQKEYIDKVIDTIVKETNIRRTAEVPFNKKGEIHFPWLAFPLGIDTELKTYFDSKDPYNSRPNFHNYCTDIFGLSSNEMKFVHDKLNFIFKDKLKNLYDLPISRFNRLNESVDNQKEYLDYVYNDLVKNTKFRDPSYREIDIYDGKCKSLQVGIRWGSVAPYFNYVPECLENYLKNTWGLTYKEIEELFWDKYEKHIINMVLSKKENVSPHVRVHVDYLRESKIGKQSEFLKKIVDTMIEETIPYNETKGSVITPFVADKNNNGRWIMSAHYCKRVVDDFDYEFNMGKIFTDYLEMFGLSYEEMGTVMYGYFKGIFGKYFKRFFDLSYRNKSKLSESVDFGFIDKVTDRVLREIVWDFDRGLVHFPMINYSSGIRDDSFLMGLDNDNPSMEGDGSYMGVPIDSWNTDLMKHIEDTYAISGSEYNTVWGSLQGEIWQKTNEYWDSFTSGY